MFHGNPMSFIGAHFKAFLKSSLVFFFFNWYAELLAPVLITDTEVETSCLLILFIHRD